MSYFARSLYELQAAQPREFVVNNHQIIVIVARKFPQRSVTLRANFYPQSLRRSYLANQFGRELGVPNMQNRKLRRSLMRSVSSNLALNFSRLRENVAASFADRGSGLEQILVPAVY